ncbi:glutathione peroxidase [Leisingera sp. JC1]|uniref:glutathione peroxidase n=1 Tax=Leisingera sp. JC1 TaxID=1855282 RepID=UPI0008034D9C|nr:glutathione peroxidase [Leisingera sp. JC1]OBY26468.1 glutathione peroxidase [Leisingera sp. JC1]
MRFFLLLAAALLTGAAAGAAPAGGSFASIDGGEIRLEDFRGRPVLVVNTASKCGFTGQYAGLQKLYDTYQAQGLVVLAVPSDDFNQELASAEEVREFCAVNYGLTLPMTEITQVTGPGAHPFYQAVRAETGFEPGWNFNKVLVAPDGSVAGTWGSAVKPGSSRIVNAVEKYLP